MQRQLALVLAFSMFCVSLAAAEPAAPTPSPVKFVAHRIGSFRSEACGVADFNGDGKIDIVAGPFVYLAPDWKPVKIRELAGSVDEKGKGYNHDFANLPLDCDGDGRLDVVSCFWHEKKLSWFRNAALDGKLWAETDIEVNGNCETGTLEDIDGDGKAREVLADTKRTAWYEVAKGADGKSKVVGHVVSEKPLDFGGGAGDVNGDGRPDIIRPGAWFEAPADIRKGMWIEHPIALGNKEEGKAEHTPQILVYDVNKDGLNDIITSSAHRYGIFWYEQVRKGGEITWRRHTIDDTWSQAHSLTLADIDCDGTPDLVSGKRFMAHNGSDPDEFGPLGVYWYKLERGPQPKWTKYAVTYNEGIGSALNVPVVDLNGDGKLDIVVTGKFGGPVWFENKGK